jgi:hypothetical protein
MRKLIIVVYAVVLFSSCAKENEAPTPTEMIVGKWQLNSFDGTNVEANLIFNQYYSDGGIILSSPTLTTGGDWHWQGDYMVVDWDNYPTSTTLIESIGAKRIIEIEEGHRLEWVKIGN